MFISFGLQQWHVDAMAIVSNDNPQTPGGIFNLDLNVPCTGVPESIEHCFASDTVDMFAYSVVQWPGPAEDNDAKSDLLRGAELLIDFGKSAFEIEVFAGR